MKPANTTTDWPELARFVVGGREVPIRLVAGRIFYEGSRVPGFVSCADNGLGAIDGVYVSQHASRAEIIDKIGRAFLLLLEEFIEDATNEAAVYDDVPGVGEGRETLPDPPDEWRRAA